MASEAERDRGAGNGPTDPSPRHTRHDAGSTLMLVPVAVLILFGLGAMALDAATLFLGQRRLADLAAAIANDAVAGIDLRSFYASDGAIELDRRRGERRADQLRSSQAQDRGLEALRCTVRVVDTAATAVCTARVRPILAGFWPIGERHRLVAAETAVGQKG